MSLVSFGGEGFNKRQMAAASEIRSVLLVILQLKITHIAYLLMLYEFFGRNRTIDNS
jgi:hypothetical protein